MSNASKKLFIGNLPWKASESELQQLFEQHGTVLSVKIVLDNYTGKSRGFGFVEMGSAEEAQEAIRNLNNTPYLGRELRVSLAEERPREHAPRGNDRGDRGDRGSQEGRRSYANSR